jgi:hypothetical protein
MKKLDNVLWIAIIALVCIAWLPIFATEIIRRFNTSYEIVGFGLAWGLSVMPFCMFMAGILLIYKSCMFIWFKKKP